MSDNIDTRVTPSFHPETVQAIAEYDDDTAVVTAIVPKKLEHLFAAFAG